MRDGNDAQCISGQEVHHAVWEAPKRQSTKPATPLGAEARMTSQQIDACFELRDKRVAEAGGALLGVIGGSFDKLIRCERMCRDDHLIA